MCCDVADCRYSRSRYDLPLCDPYHLDRTGRSFFVSTYSKPHLTIEEQIARLESRGMLIGDHSLARKYLMSVGYYNLSGYSYTMRKSIPARDGGGKESGFRDGVTFEQVVSLYQFDQSLRLLVLEALGVVEQAVKVVVAYQLGALDTFAHTNASFFKSSFTTAADGESSSQHQTWLSDHHDHLANRKNQLPFVEHYLTRYGIPLPIWVAIESMDFGDIGWMVKNLRQDLALNISRHFGIADFTLFKSWISTANALRNICAHHERLWNRVFAFKPKISSDPFFSSLNGDEHRWKRMYGLSLILAYLLAQVDMGYSWGERFGALLNTLPEGPGTSITSMGAPKGWSTHPAWQPT